VAELRAGGGCSSDRDFGTICRMEDELASDEVRAVADVARRVLVLFSVVGLALGADRSQVLNWLSENQLWAELTPSELGFVDTPTPSRKQVINASWLSERLVVLLWALALIDAIPKANQHCDTAVFQDLLPPYAPISTEEFIGSAVLRSDADLIAFADEALDLHWEARDAKLNDRSSDAVDIEIIQERHHAINWVIGYDGLPWDEVTTDT
jgi:hypothetical protein